MNNDLKNGSDLPNNNPNNNDSNANNQPNYIINKNNNMPIMNQPTNQNQGYSNNYSGNDYNQNNQSYSNNYSGNNYNQNNQVYSNNYSGNNYNQNNQSYSNNYSGNNYNQNNQSYSNNYNGNDYNQNNQSYSNNYSGNNYNQNNQGYSNNYSGNQNYGFNTETKQNTSFFQIAAMALVIIGILIVASVFLNSNKPMKVFEKVIDTTQKKVDNLSKTYIDKMDMRKYSANSEASFNINMNEMKVSPNYKLKFQQNVDLDQNYLDFNIILDNKNEEVAKLDAIFKNDKMYIDLNKLYEKILYSEIPKEQLDEINKMFENGPKEYQDIFKIIDKNLIFLKKSLKESYFEQNAEIITLNGKDVRVKANKFHITEEIANEILDNMYSQIINDDEYLDIISKHTKISKDEIKKELKEKEDIKFDNFMNNVKLSNAKSEIKMIASGVELYCKTSSLKHQLDPSYRDVCRNGVTPSEVKDMVKYNSNTKINKISYLNDKVNFLEIEANGIKLQYKNGEIIVDEDNKKEKFYEITLYTKGKNLVGFNIKNEVDDLLIYVKENKLNKITILDKNGDATITFETIDKENSNIKINGIINDKDKLFLNIDLNKKKFNKNNNDYKLNFVSNLNNEEIFKGEYIYNNIDKNNIEQKININVSYDKNSIELNFLSNLAKNKEIKIKNINDNNLQDINSLTSEDQDKIFNNLKNTLFGDLFNTSLPFKNFKY